MTNVMRPSGSVRRVRWVSFFSQLEKMRVVGVLFILDGLPEGTGKEQEG
jgi:hypothetical protein